MAISSLASGPARGTSPISARPSRSPARPASLHTEAWILATPKGLAVAFRCDQPANVPRTRQRVQRDFEDQVDRVNLMVDFDGDGRTGYDFVVSSTDGINDAVITNENQFNKDWDGNWKHAVSEDAAGWTVEILIPWYIAPMHTAQRRQAHARHLSRSRVGTTGERDAWPVASFTRPRFLSEFSRVEVPQYSQSLFAITPYVSGLYDNVRGRSHLQEGADLLWKPNGQFQLTAALNPDFGQVESDDLVVNFGATETYVERQAAVLHREPGHLRLQPARRQQPAGLYAARRRPVRRWPWRRRHQCRGQAQRQRRHHQLRCDSQRTRMARRGASSAPRG